MAVAADFHRSFLIPERYRHAVRPTARVCALAGLCFILLQRDYNTEKTIFQDIFSKKDPKSRFGILSLSSISDCKAEQKQKRRQYKIERLEFPAESEPFSVAHVRHAETYQKYGIGGIKHV